jgi:hypothetical protein
MTSTTPFPNRRIIQNSWVVPDIHAAMAAWTQTAGVGPFFLVEGIVIEEQRHRGRPTDIEVSFALAQAGDVQVELVCQHNDAPSAYRDTVPPGATAFHHVAHYCENYDRDLAAFTTAGAPIAFSGSFGGKRFCYLDTQARLGAMVELIEASDVQAEFFARIRQAAEQWDGRDPIRAAF